MAWGALMRLANGFTALSNILAAYLIVGLLTFPGISESGSDGVWHSGVAAVIAHLSSIPFPAFLLLATLCFYFGGMILNDVMDIEVDSLERPDRPLVSGAIEVPVARFLAWFLLIAGMIFCNFQSDESLTVGSLLALSIFLYNSRKSGVTGSVLMGLCRYLNWLLGLSIFYSVDIVSVELPGAGGWISRQMLGSNSFWLYILPAPIFLYVFLLTLLSKEETGATRRWPLIVCMTGLPVVLVLLGFLYWIGPFGSLAGLIVSAVALVFLQYQLFRLWGRFEPAGIQRMTKWMVLGIIPLDSLMVWTAAPLFFPGLLGAISIMLLLWPARSLSGRFKVT
jgi:4-hydroxybenzoate polyprenyltransferase